MRSIYIQYTSINKLSKAGAALVNTVSSVMVQDVGGKYVAFNAQSVCIVTQ